MARVRRPVVPPATRTIFARGCPVWVHDVLKRRAQSNAVPIGAQIVAVLARWADGEKAAGGYLRAASREWERYR